MWNSSSAILSSSILLVKQSIDMLYRAEREEAQWGRDDTVPRHQMDPCLMEQGMRTITVVWCRPIGRPTDWLAISMPILPKSLPFPTYLTQIQTRARVCAACSSQQRSVRSAVSKTAWHAWWDTHWPSTGLLLSAYWSDWNCSQRSHHGADRVSYSGDLWIPDEGHETSSLCDGWTWWPEQQSQWLLSATREAHVGNAVAEEAERFILLHFHILSLIYFL